MALHRAGHHVKSSRSRPIPTARHTSFPSTPPGELMLRHSLIAVAIAALPLGAQTQRPMTFLDVQNMRQANGQDVSPDGRQMLYVLSTPDWNQARRQSD